MIILFIKGLRLTEEIIKEESKKLMTTKQYEHVKFLENEELAFP
jgi:hypothetical protein